MKSEYVPGIAPFRPFTLTVETVEEADYLWHTINCGNDQSLDNYCIERKVPTIDDAVQTAVWKELNRRHDLRRGGAW